MIRTLLTYCYHLCTNPLILTPQEDEQKHAIDRTNIKAVVLDMRVEPSNTFSTAVEWGMSELEASKGDEEASR